MEAKRFNPTPPKKAASLQQTIDTKRPKSVLWPEFTDIDSEKWDASNKGKDFGKIKSPVTPHFEDPDGKIEMPPSITVDMWKRPNEMSVKENLMVVDLNCLNTFDLVTANEHLHDSEVMRHVITQITTLWENSLLPAPRQEVINDPGGSVLTYIHSWRPWEHIYALCKSGKGAHMPLYNPHGKYIVRLYFMGSWRKITVDDSLPFDNNGKLLLPSTTRQHELWPLLLTKGLIKIAALDYRNRRESNEFNDFNVLHHLTGWHPEIVPIMGRSATKVWKLLTNALPEWDYSKITEETISKNKPEVGEGKLRKLDSVVSLAMETTQEKIKETFSKQTPVEKVESKIGTFKEKVKSTKDLKDKAEKEQTNKTPMEDEKNFGVSSKDNEVIIFATYRSPYDPNKVSMLEEMQASASENLRQIGFSYLHPHPVWLTQTRSIPLEPPPKEEVIPRWKLIRPRKKKAMPLSEPKEIEEVLPVKSLELASSFLSYKIKPISITSDTTRRKSYLKRGDGRQRPSTHQPIEETDETLDSENYYNDIVENPTDEKNITTSGIPDDENHKPLKKAPDNNNSKKVDLAVEQKLSNSNDSQEKISIPSSLEPHVIEHVSVSEGEDKTGQKKDEEADTKSSTIPEVTGPKKTWMDFDQFCKSFQVLYIYHKSTMYKHNSHVSEFKLQVSPNPWEEKSTQYLFIDSWQSTEIVVSFSSLSHWHDIPLANQQKGADPKGKENEPITSPNLSAGSPQQEQTIATPPVPGTLAAEPYSWKTLAMGCPVLKLCTTAIRAAVLTLPPGRHVLRFLMTSPLGYSVHLLSANPFVFGDEETIMSLCTKESSRFLDNATQVILSLGKCIKCFDQKDQFEEEWKKFQALHCPYIYDKQISKVHHFEVFNDALYQSLSKVVNFKQDVIFALRVLTFDATCKTVRPQDQSRSRPTSAAGSPNGTAQAESEKLENKISIEETPIEDHIAAVKLQKCWRGGFVRKIRDARKQGTAENLKVCEILRKYWTHVELNIEEIGLDLFRTLFKNDPRLMPHYEFYKDEWNKIAYADYQGSYPDHPSDTWFVIFRGIFLVTEEMMVVPKLYIPLKTGFLRVINNDTGKEIRRVFKHVSPTVYHRNKRGYTFIAEAHSRDQAVLSSKWRLRLIGSLSPLPAPVKNDVCSSFYVHEIKDYYIPSETSSFFMNYAVKVTDDHLSTIQMSTSNPDVIFQLCVLDNGSVIYQVEGKGHAVLPAVIFCKDPPDDETLSVSSSKESLVGKAKQYVSPVAEQNNLLGSTLQMEEENDRKPHRYQIQASILRESWPLILADWQFVMALRDNLKNELEVDYKETSASPNQRPEKSATHLSKLKVGKGKLAKDAKDGKEGRPASQQFESNRPHWILQLVSDSQSQDVIEIRRDTSRAEEIRQMKKAWEEAEPGRAAKAAQSQLKYLNAHLINVEKAEIEDSLADQTPLKTPPSVLMKQKVPLLDITPFLKDSNLPTVYMDDALLNLRQYEKQGQIREYQNKRESAKEWMIKELRRLRFSKAQQLEMCRKMQLEMDIVRENYNRKREDYRRRAIEKEAAFLAAVLAANNPEDK